MHAFLTNTSLNKFKQENTDPHKFCLAITTNQTPIFGLWPALSMK